VPDASDSKYLFCKGHTKAARVGQASIDLLKNTTPMSADELMNEYSPDFLKSFEEAIELGVKERLNNPFYILVLTKKEPWAVNVVRNYFIHRQTPPFASSLIKDYKNHTKTLYIVDGKKGKVELLWSLPGWDDCISVGRHPELNSPELVRWIGQAFSGKLDKTAYTFEEGYSSAMVA
jgi:hypothetical protein